MIRCYHVTGVENLNSIFAYGLLPEKFQEGIVWLFKRPEDVTEYLKCVLKTWRGDNAVVECSVPSYQLKRGDWPAWREYYIKHRVLPNRIMGAKIFTRACACKVIAMGRSRRRKRRRSMPDEEPKLNRKLFDNALNRVKTSPETKVTPRAQFTGMRSE